MGTRFWIRRFAWVFAGATCVIVLAQLLQHRGIDRAVREGLAWGALAAVVFTASRIHQSRRGLHCEICRDTPGMRAGDRQEE